jgi:hypothetical protein
LKQKGKFLDKIGFAWKNIELETIKNRDFQYHKMKRRDFIKLTSATGITTLITPTGIMQATTLENSFLNPTNAAKPGNMWFWMNGHVTKEGIILDLEAMARVGIGAGFNFDAGTGIPKGPLKYLSPEWFEVKAHALKECDRLGIDFCMHNCLSAFRRNLFYYPSRL